MAKNKSIEESSFDELYQMKKSHTGILYVLATLMVIFVSYFGYNVWNGEWDMGGEAIIVPVIIVGASIPAFTQISAINKEINKRNKNG